MVCLTILSGCAMGALMPGGTEPVISLGVSTDGRYVISAHADRFKAEGSIVLWDIEKKRKKILSRHGNAYSAYFIPNSHEFMWQDAEDVVHIQNVDGQEVTQFPHFKTEGHLMSADKSLYLAVTKRGKIYKGYGSNQVPVYTDQATGHNKPINLSLAGNYFVSMAYPVSNPDDAPAVTDFTDNPINPSIYKHSSFDGLTLWDRNSLKPKAKLQGNSDKGFAILSPNGEWIISGDENARNYMWSTQNPHHRLTLANHMWGIYKDGVDDKSQLLPVPEKFKGKKVVTISTIAYAFLTETEFVRLGHVPKMSRTLIPLFTVGDPWMKAYLDLQENPRASLKHYQRNMSVGSSPQAHILVTGQEAGGGINVYRYHPAKKELERIWVGH